MKGYRRSSLLLLTIIVFSISDGQPKAQKLDIVKSFLGKWVSTKTEDGIKMELNIKTGGNPSELIVRQTTMGLKKGNEPSIFKRKYKIINDTLLSIRVSAYDSYKMKFKFNSGFQSLHFYPNENKLHESIPLIFLFEFRRAE
jgi:hypothetical protein